ncbi:multidrug resistance protein, MATE family [Draconibacterium orientale]|uniref:Multidrug resistance protein, MATE family n=1 Tax=Draconibacterium orientale TaxID=1168034 RepID=A0A1I0IMH1_9BACT|nr:MATE family efflux transporter [Draconibacterium orientale]SET98307.1 multidrug resistance protein, MATE family [Draconibacterium orientale]
MNKSILKLALPNIISNITVPLLGLIDLALMGHLGSEVYIGAISLGSVIFNIIYWGFGFLRMSTSGFTAQAFGEKKPTEAITILVRALILTFIISVFILLLQSPIAWASFKVIGGSPEVEKLAEAYFRIRVWAAPAALSLFVFSGWFLGMQNARYPMIIAILVNIVNILLSAFFVFGLNMKSDGVALGTAISQYVGLLTAVILFLRKYREMLPKVTKSGLIDLKFLSNFVKVNSDIFIRTFCIIVLFTFFTSKSASINDTILAVNSILLQFLMFFSFFIDGFAFAGEALVGKFIGAKQIENLKKVVKLLLFWGLGLALTFTLLYLTGTNFILKLLTSQKDVIETAQQFLIWVVLIPFASVSSFIWDGIYIGATASRPMRNSLLVSTFLIFAPVYFFLNPVWNNHALWMGMLLFMFSRGVILWLLYKKTILKPLT